MYVLPARMPRKRTASKPRSHPEQNLQEAVATYLRRVLVAPTFFTAISHGGFSLGKTPEEARRRGARMKKAGLQPGVPDILIVNRGRSLFIELKTKSGALSENQRLVHAWLAASGASVTVCRSIEDVRDRLEVWGVPTLESKLPPAERAVERRKRAERLSRDGNAHIPADRPGGAGRGVLADLGLRPASDPDARAVQAGDPSDTGADRDPVAGE